MKSSHAFHIKKSAVALLLFAAAIPLFSPKLRDRKSASEDDVKITTKVDPTHSTAFQTGLAQASTPSPAEVATIERLFPKVAEPTVRHLNFFREQKPLQLDTARVAIRLSAEELALLESQIEPLSGSSSTIKESGTPGWYFVPTGNAIERIIATGDEPWSATARYLAAIQAASGNAFASPIFVDDLGGPLYFEDKLLVGLEREGIAVDGQTFLAELIPSSSAQYTNEERTDMRVELPVKDGFELLEVAELALTQPEVSYAEPEMLFTGTTGTDIGGIGAPDRVFEPTLPNSSASVEITGTNAITTPNDPYFATAGRWGLSNYFELGEGYVSGFDLDATFAWDITQGSSSVIVVVIDNGIEPNHPDLNQWSGNGKDFTPDPVTDGRPYTSNDKHGTAVAGCVAAKINNGIGTVGIAPGCKVASARPHYNGQSDGSFTTSNTYVANAINWAKSIGAKVTVNSNGYGASSSAVSSAYASTRGNGVIHFAATGNSGASSISYPASDASVMAVGASAPTGAKASFSQYGTGIDFLAPGERVTTTDRTGSAGYASGDYATVNGTSFATPYAAGVAALMFSQQLNADVQDIEDAMAATAEDMGSAGYDTTNGWGHLNARYAVKMSSFTFTVEAGSTSNYLSWNDPLTYGMDTSQVAVRYSTTSYPTNNSEGDSLSIGPSATSYTHNFLTPGTTYYYTAFGIKSGSATLFAFGNTKTATPRPTNLNSVYWQATDGRFAIWFNDGATRTAATVASHQAPAGWTTGGRGDFDGDGKEDVLWVHDQSGRVIYWKMDGSKRVSYHEFSNAAPSGWYAAGVADFNTDDRADILWVHPTQGRVVIWYTDGTNRTSTSQFNAVAPTGWNVGGVTDFNGNGRPDIVWVNQIDSRVAIWYTALGQRSSATVMNNIAPAGWSFAQTGDFNGDGKGDILWVHPNGRVVAWHTDGGQRTGTAELATAPGGWSVMKR